MSEHFETRQSFEVGDLVKWTSQSSGSSKTKQGTIVLVVPWNEDAHAMIKKIHPQVSRNQIKFDTPYSVVERYVVKVPRGGKSTASDYYCPLPSLLEKDEPSPEVPSATPPAQVDDDLGMTKIGVAKHSETLQLVDVWQNKLGLVWLAPSEATEQETLQFLFPRKSHRFQHYKGGIYRMYTVAWFLDDEANTLYTLYQNEKGEPWIRPTLSFVGEAIVDGRAVPRFRSLGEEA